MPLEIRELTGDREIGAAFPLMRELRDRLSEETFVSEIRRQQDDGYRLFGGFDEGRLVTLAGVRRTHTLSRGEHFFVDDLVTAGDSRGKGYGGQMLRWLALRSDGEGLSRIYLDSRITARGFYEKLGFHFHTSIPSWADVGDLLKLS